MLTKKIYPIKEYKDTRFGKIVFAEKIDNPYIGYKKIAELIKYSASATYLLVNKDNRFAIKTCIGCDSSVQTTRWLYYDIDLTSISDYFSNSNMSAILNKTDVYYASDEIGTETSNEVYKILAEDMEMSLLKVLIGYSGSEMGWECHDYNKLKTFLQKFSTD